MRTLTDRAGRLRTAAGPLLFGAAYLGLQLLGLQLVLRPPGFAAFWPAAGLAVGVLMRRGVRTWPPYLAVLWSVNVAGNLHDGHTLTTSVAFAAANTTEAAVGAWLMGRSIAVDGVDAAARWVWQRLLPAALLASSGAALIGTATVLLDSPPAGLNAFSVWRVWFAADAVGIIVVAPLVRVLLHRDVTEAVTRYRGREAALAGAVQLALAGLIFLSEPTAHPHQSWPLLLLPGLFWVAVRHGIRPTTMLAGALVALAAWATGAARGPFAQGDGGGPDVLALQIFTVVAVTMALATATVVAEMQTARNTVRAQASAMANAVEGISYIGLDGNYLRLNHAYAGALGLTPADLIGTSWAPTVHPEDLPTVLAAYEVMLAEGIGSAEARGIRADGSIFHKDVTMVADRDDRGILFGHHCFMRDVTERRRSAREASRFFDMAKHLMIVTDRQGHILRVNAAWTHLLGYHPSELLGRLTTEFMHPDDAEQARDLRASMIEGASTVQVYENRFRNSAGEYRVLRWDGAYDDEVGLFHGAALDVTESNQIAQGLAEARDHAEEVSQLKSQFLATMSHEIRTPMNGVIGLGELLTHTPLDDEQRQLVEGIQTAGSGLLGVINDVLDFSKIEAGELVLDEADFDLGPMVQDLMVLLHQAADRKNIELRLEIDPALPPALHGDAGRLRQVLLNLVGNAVKFTERGSVTVRVRRDPAGPGGAQDLVPVTIDVADTGIGMDCDTVEHIFDPFTQASSSTTRLYGGTGLGLPISKQIIETMGGSISVASQAGQGTTFRVRIELQRGSERFTSEIPDGRRLPCLPVVDDPADGRQPVRVLVVEDNEINQQVAVRMLRGLGFDVDIASDGVEATEMADTTSYVAILMDCQMPRMDGYTATAILRQRAGTANTPIIAMTANAFEEDRERCLTSGMDDYLAKPIGRDALGAAMSRWTSSVTTSVGTSSFGTGRCGTARARAGHGPGTTPIGERLAELATGESEEGRSLIRGLVVRFLDAMPDRLLDITSAITAGDATAARFAAHALRGAAANLGAGDLAAICGTIEEATGSADGLRQAGPHEPRLRACADQVDAELRTRLRGELG